ncbi:MAG: methyltransferase domain-containing protein, partial [Luteibacter sp.]
LEVGIPSGQHYDPLDTLLAGVLALDEPLAEAGPLPAEMVFYQPTPARHIVDGITRGAIGPGDVVLDLGSGLGHVPLLAHILTGARCHGVERDASYVNVATRAATGLGLSGVTFTEGDARDAGFDGVDVFYLFTPFIGSVLRDVVAKIAAVAATRPVRIVALGPCTRTFARQPWLRSDDTDPEASERIVLFRSV